MYHDVFLLMPLYILCLSIGLIGTGWSLYMLVGSMSLLLYVPEMLHYYKYKKIKDKDLRRLLTHSKWFVALIKKEMLLGFIAGFIMNISLSVDNKLLAVLVFFISIIISFKYTLEVKYENGVE